MDAYEIEYLQSLKTLERRLDMLYRLPGMFRTTIRELAKMYGTGRSSIERDLNFLEREFCVPIERFSGRSGGIFVKHGWRPPGGYGISPEEEKLIRAVMEYVPEEMKAGLTRFLSNHGSEQN